MKNGDHEYHIVVFPGATSQPRRFSLKRRTVRILLVFLLVAAILETAFLVQYVTQSGEVWELQTLRSEATQHRQQATALSSAMEDLRKQLSTMREINIRMRVMLGLDPPKSSPSNQGLGGKEETYVAPQEGGLGGEHESYSEIAYQLQQQLTWLKDEASNQERHLRELNTIVGDRRAQWAATPSIWPVHGWVSSGFGRRVSPFTGRDTLHGGIDISAPMHTPVIAPAGGTVMAAHSDSGLGNMVVLTHGHGMRTIYGHMSKVKVKTGQILKRGDLIGWVGSTGLSTGPHLHYEVEVKGSNVDPLKFIIE